VAATAAALSDAPSTVAAATTSALYEKPDKYNNVITNAMH
jgi:hypothetical protein